MLNLNPPLAALHGARLDHTGAVAHGFISSAEHLAAASLRLQNHILERLAQRARLSGHLLPAALAMDVVTDPSVQQMGAGVFQEQLHLAADLNTRMVALGEWHQHSLNAVFSHWLARFENNFSVFPVFAGVSVLRKAVESADHVVSDAAVVAVQATEVLTEDIERVEKAVRPRARAGKK
jgi:hypothetical protein